MYTRTTGSRPAAVGNELTKTPAKRRSRATESEDGTLTDRAYRELEEMIVTLQLSPGTVLSEQALALRLNGVLAVIYLVFTEGYVATSGEDLMRPDLAREAIRLGRLLDALMPGRGEIKGLLALMLLHDARRAGRETAGGDIGGHQHRDFALAECLEGGGAGRLVHIAMQRADAEAVFL